MDNGTPGRPFTELHDAGLLWLINTVVFHPRGYALRLHLDERGSATGWSLTGDGSELWEFGGMSGEEKDELFRAAQQTLRQAM